MLAVSLGDFRREAFGAEAFAGIADDVLLSVADEVGRRVACRVPVLLVGRPEAGRWGPAMVKGQRANCSDNSNKKTIAIGDEYASNLARKLFGWLLDVGKLSVSIEIKVIRPTFVVARRRLEKENVNKPARCARGTTWSVRQGVIRPSHMIRCDHRQSICIHICNPSTLQHRILSSQSHLNRHLKYYLVIYLTLSICGETLCTRTSGFHSHVYLMMRIGP
jgi:hypothetical protein